MLGVAALIESQAEELQALADTPSHNCCMLADATRKNEGVESPERGGQRTEELLSLVAKERDRKM